MKYLPKFRWDMLSEQVGSSAFHSPSLSSPLHPLSLALPQAVLLPFPKLTQPPPDAALERATQTSLLRFHLQNSRTEQEAYLEAVEKGRVKDAMASKAEGRKKAKVSSAGGEGEGDGGKLKEGGKEKGGKERKYRQREVVDGVKKSGSGEGGKDLAGVLGRLF